MGIPPVIIHFDGWDFPMEINHPASLGYPHDELETSKWGYPKLDGWFIEHGKSDSDLIGGNPMEKTHMQYKVGPQVR